MRTPIVALLLPFAALAAVSCDGTGDGLHARGREEATKFATALAARDYEAAYALLADVYTKRTDLATFKFTMGRRLNDTDPITYTVVPGRQDGAFVEDGEAVQMFREDAKMRLSTIGGEAVIRFQGGGSAPWRVAVWTGDEGGQMKLLGCFREK